MAFRAKFQDPLEAELDPAIQSILDQPRAADSTFLISTPPSTEADSPNTSTQKSPPRGMRSTLGQLLKEMRWTPTPPPSKQPEVFELTTSPSHWNQKRSARKGVTRLRSRQGPAVPQGLDFKMEPHPSTSRSRGKA